MDEDGQTEPRGEATFTARRGLLFGRLDPLEELDSGGFGRVLLCHDTETSRDVAVKVLHRSAATRSCASRAS